MLWDENRGEWQPLSMCQAARCVTETFSTTCAVHVKQCEDWRLYGFRGSVADHWRLKPEMSWVRFWFSTTAGLFTFLYFLLITSEFINFQHEARCCGHILLLKPLLASGPAKNMSPACKDAWTDFATGIPIRDIASFPGSPGTWIYLRREPGIFST